MAEPTGNEPLQENGERRERFLDAVERYAERVVAEVLPEIKEKIESLLEDGDKIHIAEKGGNSTEIEVDQVTEVDYAIDSILKFRLSEMAPNSLIVTEESHNMGSEESGTQVWGDPIDQTSELVEYLKGNLEKINFAVLISVIRKGKPVAGMVYYPMRNELYKGVKGKGVEHVNTASDTRRTIEMAELTDGAEERITSRADRGYMTAKFARGTSLDNKSMQDRGIEYVSDETNNCFMIEKMIRDGDRAGHVFTWKSMPEAGQAYEEDDCCGGGWDTAAWQAIVEELGGAVVVLPEGTPPVYDGSKPKLTSGQSILFLRDAAMLDEITFKTNGDYHGEDVDF